MPRITRNFWIEADVDGRQSALEGGPRGKDGGIDLTINIREGGGISKKALRVIGRRTGEKGLVLEAYVTGDEDDDYTPRVAIQTER